ncbi:MAG TPA: sulfotransferase [Fimbriimonadaceae bacterium]|nr:sulfotransferase [Fimbriimonadaceae bacterium]
MALKVVGAGLGRTGTHSLKLALQTLLGAPCYHMVEVFEHPDHVPVWHAAAKGEKVDWEALMSGYAAAVDWPASAFWPELSAANPDALVLLSVRDPEKWWQSTQNTIFNAINNSRQAEMKEWFDMVVAMFEARFTTDLHNRDACVPAYERHNADVIARVPADRLLVWTATDGWEPICNALGLPIPAEPFPLTNTTEEFQAHHAQRAETVP